MSEQMSNRGMAIELIAQTLAPRLFQLFGQLPEEMGFPIYDTKEQVDEHVARQFTPIKYWTDRGREIAVSIFKLIEAGGATLSNFDIDVMCRAAASERPDVSRSEGGFHHHSFGDSKDD